MSRICYQLMESLGFDPEVSNRKGKVIRDLAIERGWDQDKVDGFDQPLLDRVTGFYASFDGSCDTGAPLPLVSA